MPRLTIQAVPALPCPANLSGPCLACLAFLPSLAIHALPCLACLAMPRRPRRACLANPRPAIQSWLRLACLAARAVRALPRLACLALPTAPSLARPRLPCRACRYCISSLIARLSIAMVFSSFLVVLSPLISFIVKVPQPMPVDFFESGRPSPTPTWIPARKTRLETSS